MFLALDIIIAVIFAAMIIECLHRGFLLSAAELVKTALCTGLAYLLTPAVSGLFASKIFSPMVNKIVSERMSGSVAGLLDGIGAEAAYRNSDGMMSIMRLDSSLGKINLGDINIEDADLGKIDLSKIDLSQIERADIERFLEDIPEKYIQVLDRFGVTTSDVLERYDALASGGDVSISGFVSEIASPIISSLSAICAFLAVFIASLIVLSIALKVISVNVRFPVIGKADKALGTVCGVASGIVMALVLSTVICVGFDTLEALDPIKFGGIIDKTFIVKFFGGFGLEGFLLG